MRKLFIVAAAIVVVALGVITWKAVVVAGKVSTDANILGSLAQSLPTRSERLLSGEAEGRINIVLLGMRGRGDNHGGLLTDTIMVVSYLPERNAATMVSIPRDLAINAAGERINKVYFNALQSGDDAAALAAVKRVLGEVTGQEIHYAVRINFAGFAQIVDAVGGVPIERETPFVEAVQFHEKRVCNPAAGFSVPVTTGTLDDRFDVKRNEKGKIVAKYPLCYNKNAECGGVFRVPAGKTVLDGERALCYVRARYSSNDFDRARRQQEVIAALQKKLFSVGTLADFDKVNALITALGDNIQTDMQLWEMQRFFSFYKKHGFPTIIAHGVLSDAPDGLLYKPAGAGENGTAYILRPRGDSYEKIHEYFRTIIEAPASPSGGATQ